MNIVTVERHEYEKRGLHRRGAPELAPNLPDAPLRVQTPDGEPLLVVARYPADQLAAIRNTFIEYRAAGVKRGSVHVSRTGGSRTDTTSFGFFAMQALLRRTSCRPCGGATGAPVPHAAMCEAGTTLMHELANVYPERVKGDDERAREAIHPDWFLGESYWTSGVLNVNSAIGYHFDANNLPCWSAMLVVRRGMRGGHLHIPEYDLVVPCRDGDIVCFPGYDVMHGVTPIRRLSVDAYRYTAVYYTVARMRNCGSASEQLEIGRARRTAAETGLHERQIAEGLLDEEASP